MNCNEVVSITDNKYVRGCIGQTLRVYIYLSLFRFQLDKLNSLWLNTNSNISG